MHDMEEEETPEADLWFLPGPAEAEEDLPQDEAALVVAWQAAQAAQALPLARVAARFGALDAQLRNGPEGWRHRLALIEAAELSGVAVDRLGLWQALRLSAAEQETGRLQRAGWAFRRLSGGPGPEADLPVFLERRPGAGQAALEDAMEGWASMMQASGGLHPIVRAGFAFSLWPSVGIGQPGDGFEGAVVAARLSAAEGQGGAVFAPVRFGVMRGHIMPKTPQNRLEHWLFATEQGLIRALRMLEDLRIWEQRVLAHIRSFSGRTPPRLVEVLRDWPLVSAALCEDLTGASRAAVQRNLQRLQAQGLVAEVTGQSRFRLWRAAI